LTPFCTFDAGEKYSLQQVFEALEVEDFFSCKRCHSQEIKTECAAIIGRVTQNALKDCAASTGRMFACYKLQEITS
jgi:hypothetical protein